MEQKPTKEQAQKLMKIKGEVRGVTFKTDIEYILREKGEGGLKEVEQALEKLGVNLKYKDIKTMDFYPVGLRVLSLLVIKDVFNFSNDKIKEMGLFATKVSLIIKLFTRYFLSLQRVFFKEAPRIWKKHWTVGTLLPVELNEKEQYAIIRLKNFNLHPIYCHYLGGYFCGVLQLIIKSTQITSEETKCSFLGDEYHEYLIKWK